MRQTFIRSAIVSAAAIIALAAAGYGGWRALEGANLLTHPMALALARTP